jgi:hypothetical protein
MLRTPAAQSRGCSGLGHQTKMPRNGHDCPSSPRDPGCSGSYVLSAYGFTLVLPLALLSQPPYYLGITWVGRILYQRTIYVDYGRIRTVLTCGVMSSSSARLITPGSLFILADFLRRCRHLNVCAGLAERFHCSFAYFALACFRMGMSGSASFQSPKKSWYALFALTVSPERA